jgi:hypothetical protein
MNEILLVNPHKRHKRRKAKSRRRGHVRLRRHAARRRRVHRVKARRYHRNPSFSLKSVGSSFVPVIKSGALGAVGALANDALVGQLVGFQFMPDAVKSGYGKHALKIGSAIIVGTVGGMVAKGKGKDLAVGASTVAIHGLLRDVISANLPSVAPYLGDYEDVGAYNPAQLVDETGGNMGEYIPGVGEYVPGMVSGDDDM